MARAPRCRYDRIESRRRAAGERVKRTGSEATMNGNGAVGQRREATDQPAREAS
jgi:hypothetical protein